MPDPPLPSPSSSIRLGTFNVGLGLLRKLPNLLLRCSTLSLDIIALQETGDPALFSNFLLNSFSYTLVHAPGPSHHESGVAFLISSHLIPRVRGYKRSHTGRLVGAVLDLAKGQHLLVISAYMPSGLDSSHLSSDKHLTAQELYSEILLWCSEAPITQAIVMGDLNQTLTPYDRFPIPVVHHSLSPSPFISPIFSLPQSGFVDVFRNIHPSPSTHPGYTHESYNRINKTYTRSRIDYIWAKGFSPLCYLNIRIDAKLSAISHHRLVWLELAIKCSLPDADNSPSILRLRLPNLRSIHPEQMKDLAHAVDIKLLPTFNDTLSSLSPVTTERIIDAVVHHITTTVHDAAFKVLPITGSAQLRNKSVMHLHRQRTALIKLLRITHILLLSDPHVNLHSSPEWSHQYYICIRQYRLEWEVHAHCKHGVNRAWLQETESLIRRNRAAARQHRRKLSRKTSAMQREELNTQSTAVIHRMLDSNNLPSQLFSVIDASGELTSNAAVSFTKLRN